MSAYPVLVGVDQYGEQLVLTVLPASTADIAAAIADGTILSNLSGSTGAPSANTLQAIANAVPAKTGVTAISALSATTAASVSTAGGNTYADAAINTALSTTNTNINLVVTKLNAVLAALKVQS